jgi:hypothetical protein
MTAAVAQSPHLVEVHRLPTTQEVVNSSVFVSYCAGNTERFIADRYGVSVATVEAVLASERARRKVIYKQQRCVRTSCGRRHRLDHYLSPDELRSLPVCGV